MLRRLITIRENLSTRGKVGKMIEPTLFTFPGDIDDETCMKHVREITAKMDAYHRVLGGHGLKIVTPEKDGPHEVIWQWYQSIAFPNSEPFCRGVCRICRWMTVPFDKWPDDPQKECPKGSYAVGRHATSR